MTNCILLSKTDIINILSDRFFLDIIDIDKYMKNKQFKKFYKGEGKTPKWQYSSKFFTVLKKVFEKERNSSLNMTEEEFENSLYKISDMNIYYWTHDMLMCKERQGNCKGCFYENFFSKYDAKFSKKDQSIEKCNLKSIVKEALRIKINENRTFTRGNKKGEDEFI